MNGMVAFCDRVIRYSFYSLFFFVPLFFTSNTSELFELNKMWLTWGLTTIIAASWIIKMIVQRKISIQRTPLDIPILLFLLSQAISTIISLDSRVSFWGYYSRFNGGLLSFISYTILYYAFVSNDMEKHLKKVFYATLSSLLIVALWGLPSHFGYDPTCLIFRGTLDTSCWTEGFKPTVRIFSSLGQPAWMTAYLAALLPIVVGIWVGICEKINGPFSIQKLKNWKVLSLLVFIIVLYFDLLFANTRGGFLAFWAANGIFWLSLFFLKVFPVKKLVTYLVVVNFFFFFANFLIGTPVGQLNKLTMRSFQSPSKPATTQSPSTPTPTPVAQPETPIQTGITDSADIRVLVWKGAVDIWKSQPLFGSGAETFAYAYYQHRPATHNMTSEWDYLYNKAHNEYLNYLATTGAVGLLTHLSILGVFIYLWIRYLLSMRGIKEKHNNLSDLLLACALPAGFVSIIISNFFGFSVVIMNIFLYFFPLWFFMLTNKIRYDKTLSLSFQAVGKYVSINPYQWTGIIGIFFIAICLLYQLVMFWQADVAYALGYNYDRAQSYQNAYTYLAKAVQMRSAEPVFKDEFALNLATLATAFVQNNDASTGAQLAEQAITLTKDVTEKHPNNVVFWKTRVRVYYLLAQVDNKYYQDALNSILSAQKLAPTDAKISYNVGVLYGQNGIFDKGITELTHTITLKPNYRDAYFARALFYKELAARSGGVDKTNFEQKAKDDLNYIIKNINPNDADTLKALSG
ncbi:MAG: O-antigen ligase family protein [Candidatus Levybacteria bacterium]|nr:O-antigen ligase family protein [Candidatus Levybacteria bacterium]